MLEIFILLFAYKIYKIQQITVLESTIYFDTVNDIIQVILKELCPFLSVLNISGHSTL